VSISRIEMKLCDSHRSWQQVIQDDFGITPSSAAKAQMPISRSATGDDKHHALEIVPLLTPQATTRIGG
jgi:hypothetical protein